LCDEREKEMGFKKIPWPHEVALAYFLLEIAFECVVSALELDPITTMEVH
jgi:hypothetical protein